MSNRTGATFNSAYSSVLENNGGSSPAVEMERARIKIRKLEKEVISFFLLFPFHNYYYYCCCCCCCCYCCYYYQVHVIEGQLATKTKQAEAHVEELAHLKSKMAQEKSSNTLHFHQVQEKAAR